MSNILAGIGRGQMEVIEERVKSRRATFRFYRENMKDIDGVDFLEEPNDSYFSNYWLTTMLIDPSVTHTSWEEVQRNLEKENIETRPLWKPMHLQPVFSSFPAYINGVSEDLFSKGLCLPSGSIMTDGDRMRVLAYLKKSLRA
jgi:dTDP-4-amino-4,6-dideoxygalactose transaminase